MIKEKVYSPVFDKKLQGKYTQEELNKSPIWKEAIHETELGDVKKPLTEYTIKFDGLTPIQVTKIKNLKR